MTKAKEMKCSSRQRIRLDGRQPKCGCDIKAGVNGGRGEIQINGVNLTYEEANRLGLFLGK